MAQAPTPTTERPGPWLPRLRSCIWWCLLDVAGEPSWPGRSLPESARTGRAGLVGGSGIPIIGTAAAVVHGEIHLLEPVGRPVAAAGLGTWPALAEHHVGRVVALALEQRRSHRVGVDRHAAGLERGDPPRGEATRDDHADVREALGVQRLADLPDQPRVDAGRDEIPHLTPERTVDHHAGGVQAH